jgi:hypothetical protein
MDPHHFGKSDSDRHHVKSGIRIRITVKSWIRIRVKFKTGKVTRPRRPTLNLLMLAVELWRLTLELWSR